MIQVVAKDLPDVISAIHELKAKVFIYLPYYINGSGYSYGTRT